jgi:hypothetical protein
VREKYLDILDIEGESKKISGVVIGLLVEITDTGEPIVDFSRNDSASPIEARTTVALSQGDIGREITLLFEEGDWRKPIIIGVIRQTEAAKSKMPDNNDFEKRINMEIDGERVTFTAQKEIVLRCGKASITLTRAGKIVIRGAYLLNRSSGVNRIKGGSVQIN